MDTLQFAVDGETVVGPTALRDGEEVWVPLPAFCAAVDAVLKDTDGHGHWAVCDEEGGDVCVLLADADLREVDGTPFGRLAAFAAPLEIGWSLNDGVLVLTRGITSELGLGVGQLPPPFRLPDVDSGQLVSSDVYIDKPAVFYMWASW